MKRRNILIIVLLLCGLGALALVEGYIKPHLRTEKERYLAEQQEPLTHDFDRLLEFKRPYMGDASNLANLNAALPLSDIQRTFELFPESLTAEINYQCFPATVEGELFRRALVYNATANFVLIANLETLVLNFGGESLTISRPAVERWYGVELVSLQQEEKWAEQVQRPLASQGYVDAFIEESFVVE